MLSNLLDVELAIVEFQSRHGEETTPRWVRPGSDLSNPLSKPLIVDDIIDTGNTIRKIAELFPRNYKYDLLTLVKRPNMLYNDTHIVEHFNAIKSDNWIIFPWESVDEN